MKKLLYSLISIALVSLISCEETLDTKLDNNYGEEITWKLPDYALGVLMNGYNAISQTPNHYAGDFLDVATDNAFTNDRTSNLAKYVMGGISANNSGPFNNWSTAYNQFRNIHLFLENGLGDNILYSLSDSIKDMKIRNRSRGEAYFLRAWWGMKLLQNIGGLTADGQALGYPIITKNLTEEDSENLDIMQRNSYEDCVLQILADCDSAYKYLPLKYAGSDEDLGIKHEGRASGQAALALQSRVALYAASPAYQPTDAYAISTDSLESKWTRVVELTERAITQGAAGNYAALTESMYVGSAVQGSTDPEFIFRTWYNNRNLEIQNFPPMFFGAGKTNPSQNLVDAYPAINGYPISDPRSAYDPQDPYVNRDGRFELTIYYNGQVFNSDRPLEIFVDTSGVKGRDVAGYDYNNTATGYYLRKFLSPKKDMLYNPSTLGATNDFHQFPLLRRAELYYNLAEALNELAGPKGVVPESSRTAYDILSDIRSKNGITSNAYLDEVAVDKNAFMDLLMNERRIEFAFENMRFHDLRRRLLPLNDPIKGVKIAKTESGLEFEGTDPNDDPVIIEQRRLDDPKYYYLPLPYNETIRNPNLVQNKGW